MTQRLPSRTCWDCDASIPANSHRCQACRTVAFKQAKKRQRAKSRLDHPEKWRAKDRAKERAKYARRVALLPIRACACGEPIARIRKACPSCAVVRKRDSGRKHYEANREVIIARAKAWAAKHPKAYLRNPDYKAYWRDHSSKWRKKNRPKVNAIRTAYRSSPAGRASLWRAELSATPQTIELLELAYQFRRSMRVHASAES